jgi:hypothetical protein
VRNPRKYGRLRTAAFSVLQHAALSWSFTLVRVITIAHGTALFSVVWHAYASTQLAIRETHGEPDGENDEQSRERETCTAGPFSLVMFVLQLPLTPAFGVGLRGICRNWTAHLIGVKEEVTFRKRYEFTVQKTPGRVLFNCEHRRRSPSGYAAAP